MKRIYLKFLLISAVAVGMFGCLKDAPENDNTPFVGEWNLTNIFSADYYYPKRDSLAHDTLLYAEIPADVCRWNLLLNGTGEIVQTDYVFGAEEGERFEAGNFPIKYSWQNSLGYTYLFVNRDKYYSSFIVGKLTTDSLALHVVKPVEYIGGIPHQVETRWIYTK